MRFRDLPATLHLTFSAATAASSDDIAADLADATAAAREPAPSDCRADLARDGRVARPGDPRRRRLRRAARGRPGSAAAAAGSSLPDRMAPVNALLDASAPGLREALLLGFLDRLSRPA